MDNLAPRVKNGQTASCFFYQGAHPNAAHTALRPDCARFQVPPKSTLLQATLFWQINLTILNFRELSPVLLGMKSALWTTRPPAAPAGESEVPTVMVLTLVLMPTPNCTPIPWLELTLRQELTPTRLPTTPLSSPTRLILSQQPFQATPSKLCNKTVLNSPWSSSKYKMSLQVKSSQSLGSTVEVGLTPMNIGSPPLQYCSTVVANFYGSYEEYGVSDYPWFQAALV